MEEDIKKVKQQDIDLNLTEEENALIQDLAAVVDDLEDEATTEVIQPLQESSTPKWLFWAGSALGIFLALILLIGFFVIRAVFSQYTIVNKNSLPNVKQEKANIETKKNNSSQKENVESTQSKKEPVETAQTDGKKEPTLAGAKVTVENFLLAYEDSDSQRMRNLLVGDAYDKFDSEIDAVPYDYNITEGTEFESGLFSFKVTTYFKGAGKDPYLEDWIFQVAKTDEGYLRIYERNFQTWTYFTPE